MFERLVVNSIMRDYKILHENSRNYNQRIYNRFISNKIIIAWKNNVNNSLDVFKAKNVLIKARNNKRFDVFYWYLIYIPLRYSLIFSFNKLL